MSWPRRARVLVAATALGGAVVLAQAGQARDASSPPLTDVPASISGVVVADDGPRTPVRRATLTLTPASGDAPRITSSDDRGRYLFADLPVGVYTLAAAKGGFVATSYGSARAGLPGNPIPIGAGQAFPAEPIVLRRGAVVTGRLVDAKGHPVSGIAVEASRFQVADGARRRRAFSGAVRRTVTDVRGTYRIFGLAPGDYLVLAQPVGRQDEIREVSPAEIRWAQQAAGAAPEPPHNPPRTLAPTFYPGTADVSNAAVVSLSAGEEKAGLDFVLRHVGIARVSGTVTAPDGQPAEATLSIERRGPWGFAEAATMVRSTPEGTYTASGLAPGEYSLIALPRATAGIALWGRAEFVLRGEDMPSVDLRLQPTPSVNGRVKWQGADTSPAIELARVRIQMRAQDGPRTSAGATGVAAVAPDGTFRIQGLVPSQYRMTVDEYRSGSTTWRSRSVIVNGREVLDLPFDISPTDQALDALVTFSDKTAELSGQLVDAQGRPAPQFFVLVYPVDRRYWAPGSPRVRPIRVGVDGTFRIVDLPPGEYQLCALTEIDTDQQYDADYLEQFVPASIRVTLVDGERRTQVLRIGS
jgi:hypothetical protein